MSTTNKAEVIASRKTFDGKTVELWSDGAVTVGNGMTVRFVKGAGTARTPETRAANVRAGFAVIGNACVLTADELPKAVAAARRAETAGKSAAEVSRAA
jgi:hypothetical protein